MIRTNRTEDRCLTKDVTEQGACILEDWICSDGRWSGDLLLVGIVESFDQDIDASRQLGWIDLGLAPLVKCWVKYYVIGIIPLPTMLSLT